MRTISDSSLSVLHKYFVHGILNKGTYSTYLRHNSHRKTSCYFKKYFYDTSMLAHWVNLPPYSGVVWCPKLVNYYWVIV